MQAILALEDGTVFHGRAFGAAGERAGEVVFNTGMTGYQEILTDPSYKGQMVCMTYPHIGNYGVNDLDLESCVSQAEALLVRDVTEVPSNWLSEGSLSDLLCRHNVMGITDIDTRALTKHLRQFGVMRAMLSTVDSDGGSLVKKAVESPDISELHLVAQVSTKDAYQWTEATSPEWSAERYWYREPASPHPSRPYRVVVIDTGVKYNILRRLVDSGCDVWVVPYDTPAPEVLRHDPEGIVLPNGPGDPETAVETLETARSLMGVKPIFGICLGHQILGLAAGGRKIKLKFGHHGLNHPVRLENAGTVEITSQNHNYAIAIDSLDLDKIEVTHINLNDGTLEGTRHRHVPIYSVQFHPEASPGPHDSSITFRPFAAMMEEARR